MIKTSLIQMNLRKISNKKKILKIGSKILIMSFVVYCTAALVKFISNLPNLPPSSEVRENYRQFFSTANNEEIVLKMTENFPNRAPVSYFKYKGLEIRLDSAPVSNSFSLSNDIALSNTSVGFGIVPAKSVGEFGPFDEFTNLDPETRNDHAKMVLEGRVISDSFLSKTIRAFEIETTSFDFYFQGNDAIDYCLRSKNDGLPIAANITVVFKLVRQSLYVCTMVSQNGEKIEPQVDRYAFISKNDAAKH